MQSLKNIHKKTDLILTFSTYFQVVLINKPMWIKTLYAVNAAF